MNVTYAAPEAKEAPTREDYDQLRERLAVAETVCTIFGWTGTRTDGERDKAVSQAWQEWAIAYGSPKPTPEWDERVTELAAKRDEIRNRTLAAIRERHLVPAASSVSEPMPAEPEATP